MMLTRWTKLVALSSASKKNASCTPVRLPHAMSGTVIDDVEHAVVLNRDWDGCYPLILNPS